MAEVLIGTVTDNNGVVINVYGTESGGNTTFRIEVVEGYADLRGFFFDYTGTGITLNNTTDDAFDQNGVLIMDGTAVTASYMGTSADGNDITKVGSSDNNLNGTGEVFDAGVEIGTSGIGKNDIGSVTFTINGLTLTEIDGLSFGIRATSVGDTLADRSDSVKLIGEFDVPEANTPPVAVADTDDATEAGGVDNGTAGTDATGNVLDNDTDADVGDTKEVTTTGEFVGTYGTLTLNADGTYTYVIDNTDTDVQALRTSGQTLSESFNYTMKDGAGSTSSSTLTITIHGANDNPVAVADTNAGDPVVESGVNPGNTPFPGDGSAAGNVLANDTDPDTGETATLAVSAVNGVGGNVGNAVVGTYGSVTINATGGYSYTLNNADGDTNALTQGQAVSDVFSYTIVDAFGATSTANLTIDITGTNDGPVAANDNWVLSDTAIAAGIITPFWFTHNDTDPDGNPVFVSAVSSLPAGLTANFSGGQLVDITGTAAAGNYVINYTLSDGSATDTNNTVSLTVLDTTVGNNQGIVLNGNDFSYVDLQAGNDSITGDLILVGNAGIDIFIGGDGNENALSGGGGADSLSGGNDNDVLFGGEGTDALTGGLGNDAFAWSSILEFGDLVTDFVSNAAGNNDNLRFDVGATGTQIPVGDNDTTVENFEAGTIAATDDGTSHEVVVVTDDNIDGVGDLGVQGTINLYNGIGTGALFVFDVGSEAQVWYDGNPSAAGGATLVATLTSITDITNTTFTATDFVFV